MLVFLMLEGSNNVIYIGPRLEKRRFFGKSFTFSSLLLLLV